MTRPTPLTQSIAKTRRRSLGVLSTAATVLAGCASIDRVDTVPSSDLAPVVEVAVTRSRVLPGPPEVVFAFIAAEDVLPAILTGYGPLPGVVGTSGHSGPWDRAGSTRVVHLADGSAVREQVTDVSPPGSFSYRVWDFSHPVIRRLANGAQGRWTFEPDTGGTRVTWTYTFSATSRPAAWPLAGIVRWLWRGYMDVCLDNSQRLLSAKVQVSAAALPPR